MPAMRWSIDDEAKDLEDAIWAAAEVAEKIEGAYVQVACTARHPSGCHATCMGLTQNLTTLPVRQLPRISA